MREPDAPVRVVAVGTVTDEADMLPTFVSHTLSVVDAMLLIAHCPTEAVRARLSALKSAHPGLRVASVDDPRYRPVPFNAKLLAMAIEEMSPDWVLPLWPDEIVRAERPAPLRAVLRAAGAAHLRLLPHVHVPAADDDPALTDPVQRLRHRFSDPYSSPQARINAGRLMLNAALVAPYADRYALDANASALWFRGGTRTCGQPVVQSQTLTLRHFPARTRAQVEERVRRLQESAQAGGDAGDKAQLAAITRTLGLPLAEHEMLQRVALRWSGAHRLPGEPACAMTLTRDPAITPESLPTSRTIAF